MTSSLPPSGRLPQPEFLPAARRELEQLGWAEVDILLIQGDAHLDHPANGPALLGRWLVAHGFRVGLISQPRWRDPAEARDDLTALGQPRLLAALSAGSMDSMLAHYTAFRQKRSTDALTPGGRTGARPNRATLVYAGLARAAFPGRPVLIGGLEASLRRLSHYDFWQDKLRPSILLEAKADLLVYGPGERPLLEVARRLAADGPQADLSGIPGTVTPGRAADPLEAGFWELPSHQAIQADPRRLMEATLAAEKIIHQGGPAARQITGDRSILVWPPARPLTTSELDDLYGLPFTRRAHPSLTEPVPALALLATSITTHRGCGGGCSFCSLALHQSRRMTSRSAASILAEAGRLARVKPVALSDVGAATANLWGSECGRSQPCRRRSCLWPQLCPHLRADQRAWLALLRQIADLPGIKQVRVASGIRYDLALTDEASLAEFLKHYVGGQLKVAPEHLDSSLLDLMRKPGPELFEKFMAFFRRVAGPGRFVIPYLLSGFPGSDLRRMRRLADWLQKRCWRPRQVQAFIPTPGTVATAMYYAGIDENGQPLAVARTDRERRAQHDLLAPKVQSKN
ncbi:MAG: YgiQ family radical SAM protein [Candidatus Adiutrix sp.]|jgi:uncharacterized radical SAM protein YgiQ|nr:YgiQ family radical SAM protein [Candidatus Adiutrix sp.]